MQLSLDALDPEALSLLMNMPLEAFSQVRALDHILQSATNIYAAPTFLYMLPTSLRWYVSNLGCLHLASLRMFMLCLHSLHSVQCVHVALLAACL